ncbi:iron-containing alcohol dehydrogenase [Vibrio agarivorans]|uniref:iron-containing alcohol dehydrogenase n=1 Tax=Vibrio agarivorans TaxID=153622 RepID=UPI0022308941|nr:iron-containing alcohol dehydrogenase [Vibrio agarivorans]
MRKFSIPTTIYSGNASIDELSSIVQSRILIICDQFLAGSEALKRIVNQLCLENQVDLYCDVTPDPSTDDVAKGVEALAAFSPDILIAYGGGSAIDLSKAVRFCAREHGIEVARFIAVPTTSGTGSEVTQISVISVSEHGVKVPLVDDALLPDVAILDPMQTVTVPPAVTANTGIDVLTHAIEAMVSVDSDDFSNALAEKAITLVFKYLKPAYEDGNNLKARQKLLNASCLAGLAFNHAGLGLTHAIAHQLGASLHIPHGLANALLLTEVMEYNCRCKRSEETYAVIARCLGFVPRHTDCRTGAKALIKETAALIASVGISATSARLQLNHKHDQNLIETMAQQALGDITIKTNPVKPSIAEVSQILQAI